MQIHPWIISLVCGIVTQLTFSFGYIIGLIVLIKFSLGVVGFCLVTSLVMAIGVVAIGIDTGYGIEKKTGWRSTLKR